MDRGRGVEGPYSHWFVIMCVCIASCLASTLPYFAKIDLVGSETKLESSIKQEQSFP